MKDLKAGQSKGISLYPSRGTDALLAELADAPEVEWLTLSHSDVSDAGFAAIATLPNLKTLTIDGARSGLTDSGLAELSRVRSLEALTLTNTRMTAAAVEKLKKQLPGCTISIDPPNQVGVPSSPKD